MLLGEQPGATHALVIDSKPIPLPDSAPWCLSHRRKSLLIVRISAWPNAQLAAAIPAQQGVATAQLFPDVSLSGFFGLLNVNPADFLHAASKSWDLVGNATWPILNFGKLSAGVDLPDAKQKEA